MKKKIIIPMDELIPNTLFASRHKIFENKVLSNLPLQMALYLNLIFFPVWFLIMCVYIYNNYNSYNSFNKFMIVAIIVTITVVEVGRLYLGYEGNLLNKIPELAGFWLLSVLLQLPLYSFLLLNPDFEMNVLEFLVQFIMTAFLGLQIISGYYSLKYTSHQQADYYRIKHQTIRSKETGQEVAN